MTDDATLPVTFQLRDGTACTVRLTTAQALDLNAGTITAAAGFSDDTDIDDTDTDE